MTPLAISTIVLDLIFVRYTDRRSVWPIETIDTCWPGEIYRTVEAWQMIRRVNEKIQLPKSSEVEINDSMRVLAFDTRMAGCAIDYNYISDVIARVTMRRTGERCLWALPSGFGETSASFLVPFAFISFFSSCFAFLFFSFASAFEGIKARFRMKRVAEPRDFRQMEFNLRQECGSRAVGQLINDVSKGKLIFSGFDNDVSSNANIWHGFGCSPNMDSRPFAARHCPNLVNE